MNRHNVHALLLRGKTTAEYDRTVGGALAYALAMKTILWIRNCWWETKMVPPSPSFPVENGRRRLFGTVPVSV